MLRVHLRNHHDLRVKLLHCIVADIHQRRVGSHPGRTRRGINGENALARIEEVGRITGDLEGGKSSRLRVLCDIQKEILRRVVEKTDLPLRRGIGCIFLGQIFDHHIVGRLIDERNHDVLTIHRIGSVAVFLRGRLGNLPDEVPGQCLRQGVAQFFHIGLIHIAGLGGTHEGQGIIMPLDAALGKELRNDLLLRRRVESQTASAKAVSLIRQKLIQRHHRILAREVSCDVVRVGDADVRRRVRGDVGDDVVINFSVIRIQLQIHRDVWVKGLKIGNCLLIDIGLGLVRIVFRPEGKLIIF